MHICGSHWRFPEDACACCFGKSLDQLTFLSKKKNKRNLPYSPIYACYMATSFLFLVFLDKLWPSFFLLLFSFLLIHLRRNVTSRIVLFCNCIAIFAYRITDCASSLSYCTRHLQNWIIWHRNGVSVTGVVKLWSEDERVARFFMGPLSEGKGCYCSPFAPHECRFDECYP